MELSGRLHGLVVNRRIMSDVYINYKGFEVLTVLSVKVTAFLNVTLCIPIDIFQIYQNFSPDDGSRKFLRNVDKCLPYYISDLK
jgi:hypothetical protein